MENYIIAGAILIICIIAIVTSLRVFKESRNMIPSRKEHKDNTKNNW